MIEFLKSNGTAVISAFGVLIGALIAGLFATAGSLLNYKANNRVRESQFELEKWKANRSLFLDRGEEALSLLSRVTSHSLSFNNIAVTESIGDKSGKISDKVTKALSDKEIQVSLDRLDAIITAYFPELSNLKNDLVKNHQASVMSYVENRLGKQKIEDTATLMLNNNDLTNEISSKLKISLSQKMGAHL